MVEWEGLGMGSTSYLTKPKSAGFRAKSGSSVGSDREMNGKLKRNKIRRPTKMNDYGVKRIPDYTELAYKEAVSKLRYFLSGNYAPSARSYGGSASIKNLDESDGDLDKKYLSPYNTVTDYKPKPRLTAKYATLYADSLKNTRTCYTPEPVNVAPTTGADPSAANPDVVNFIQKQEEYIEQLERESQYCRDELNNLLGKVKEVISENEHLHEAQKNKLISRMFHTYNGSETDDVDDSTGLDSDNKISPSKSRKTIKTRSTRLEGPNIVFESRIAELEAQLTQAKIDFKKIQDENNENKRKLASGLVDSTCLDGFKRQIDNLQRDKSTLESQISKLKVSLEQRDDDSGRYRRSEVVEQQLREEKNNLESEIRSLKEELSKERGRVRELAGAGARVRARAEHFDDLHHDLAAQYDNVAKLQLELDRQRRDENDLKRELALKNSAIEELKMELKNKTASLQADLSQAHAEKASLDEELASARLALERHQRQAKHETNRLNSEIQSLRQRLDRADADLVHSRRENLRLSEQISNLEKEINMKTLTPVTPEKNKKEKELSTMLESMENKHAKTVAELEAMIHSQNSLMEKLTGECRLLTDKLDDANRMHKKELATLQRQVDTIGRTLQPQDTHSYQAHPTHASPTNGNVSIPSPPRHDDPRAESPGHTGYTNRPDRERQQHLDQQTPTIAPEIPVKGVRQEKHNTPVKEKPMEVEQPQIEQQQNNETHYQQDETLEQNYEPTPGTEYQQEYQENYEQPNYSDEQYQNYEQYPQYTDPNAQYTEGEYNNYPAENYQENQNYDQTQYENAPEYTQEQYQGVQETEQVESKPEEVLPQNEQMKS